MGKTECSLPARVNRIVPAQHLRSSFPFETLPERWLGSVSGSRLAQCSDNCVHKMRSLGNWLRIAAIISGLGVPNFPRPIEKINFSGLLAAHNSVAKAERLLLAGPPP